MITDRKGDIGFMEAMAGTMTVCIVLLAFISFFFTETALESNNEHSFDWNYVGDVSVVDNAVSVDYLSDLDAYIEEENYVGILIKIHTSGTYELTPYCELFGEESEEHISEKTIKNASDLDGRLIPMVLEVTLFT